MHIYYFIYDMYRSNVNNNLICVELMILFVGSLGDINWASLGFVISTTGHSPYLTSVKDNKSWSTANILYLKQYNIKSVLNMVINLCYVMWSYIHQVTSKW